jgi:6-pyruvoyl tetrahydropterin synthase/QueD family protein
VKNFITKQMYAETGHRLCDYEGKCAHLHGHSYRWEVTVQCKLSGMLSNDMIMDFKDLKAVMQETIGAWDHAFLFNVNDPLLALLSGDDTPPIALPSRLDQMRALVRGTDGERGRLFIYSWNPPAEAMGAYQFKRIKAELDEQRVQGLHQAYLRKVCVWETATSFAEVEMENPVFME